jgi:protein-S-isoprenylcysteine O-methyltransferase Ste14
MERIIFAVFSSIFVLIRIKFHQPERANAREVHAKRELFSAIQFSLILFLSHGIWLFTSLFSFAETNFPPYLPIVGAFVMAIGLVMLYSVHNTLGSNFSARLEVQQDHILVQSGLYKYIRHPMYSSGFLYLLGAGLLSSNIIILCLPLLSFSGLVLLRITDEERMLEEHFGQEWKQYKRTTGRLSPWF